MSLKISQNYKDKETNQERNYLTDLNWKFKSIPFFLKYYDKNPTNEELENIRGVSILNLLLYFNPEDWPNYISIFLNETNHIFK